MKKLLSNRGNGNLLIAASAAIVLVLVLVAGGMILLARQMATQPLEPVAVAPVAGDSAEDGAEDGESVAYGAITGVLVDTEGTPLPDVRLGYTRPSGSESFTRTGPDGAFKLTLLEPGAYTFAAYPSPEAVEREGIRYAVQSDAVELTGGESRSGVEVVVRISQPALISGSVVNHSGAPLANTEVFCDVAFDSPAITEADGSFILQLRIKEGTASLAFRRGNYGVKEKNDVALGTRDLEVTMEEGAELQFHVVAEEGNKPVPTYTLSLESEKSDSKEYVEPLFEAKVESAEGTHTIHGVAPGRYRMRIVAPGHALHEQSVVAQNLERRRVPVVLSSEEGFRGLVLDADTRQPVPHARIYLNALPEIEYDDTHVTETNAQGAFTLGNLPDADSITLGVMAKRNYAPTLLTVDISRSPVTIQLTRAALFMGYVTVQGQPLPDAAVTVYRKEDDGSIFVRRKRTDENGAFMFSNLPPGRYFAEAANHLNPDDLFRRTRVNIEEGYEISHSFEF